jgi:predicted regulator of Ras-like GTPase activity (Roadblock/LC7/MglB family)
VDAAQVLKDLTEISSQIEAAVLVAADGSVLAATLQDDTSAGRLATAAQALVGAAEGAPRESGEGPLVQLEVATMEGNVFVVRDGERVVAAVTSADPTAGLVFYDLKSCLRAAAAEQGDGKPRPRARRTRKAAAEGVSGEISS